MPKDRTNTIDFLEVYKAMGEQPVRDTIRDTVVTDTASIRQVPAPQDTIVRDTLATPDTLPAQAQADTAAPDSTVATPADTAARADQTVRPPTDAERREAQTTRPATREETDTLSGLYRITGATELPISKRLEKDPAHINFLYNIPAVKPREKAEVGDIYRPTKQTPGKTRQEIREIEQKPLHPEKGQDYDWVTLVLAGSLLLIGWSRLLYRKYFVALVKSFHFYNYASSLYYGKNSLTERAGVLLNLNFFITGGLLGFQALSHSEYTIQGFDPIYQWLLFSGFLMVWYVWNFLTSRAIGFLFLRERVFNQYLHNYNLYRKLMGISLLPFAVVVQFIREEYQEMFLLVGGILAATIFIAHIIRGLQVFAKENVSILYLFLYLCALEFLPLILVFKVFIRELSA